MARKFISSSGIVFINGTVVPMAGLIDDLIVAPLGLALMRKLIPDIGVMEKQERAQKDVKQILPWVILSLVVFTILVLVWLGLLIYLIVKFITG